MSWYVGYSAYLVFSYCWYLRTRYHGMLHILVTWYWVTVDFYEPDIAAYWIFLLLDKLQLNLSTNRMSRHVGYSSYLVFSYCWYLRTSYCGMLDIPVHDDKLQFSHILTGCCGMSDIHLTWCIVTADIYKPDIAACWLFFLLDVK
jgi:hypothetical protein